MEQNEFKDIVLIVDANYLDETAGGLAAFLSQQMQRQMPAADLAVWMVNATMGIMWEKTPDARTADFKGQQVQVVMVCEKGQTTLKNMHPSGLLSEVDGMAFREEEFGEFLMSVVQDEHLIEGEPLIVQSVEMLLTSERVKHLIVVASPYKGLPAIERLKKENPEKDIELLTMQPTPDMSPANQLGLSILYSLGVSLEELNK